MKKISFVSPTFNEEENIKELVDRVRDVWNKNPNYDYEYVIIDNSSSDYTQQILENLATQDIRIKLIFNTRNFGHIRSPYWGILQASGDAIVYLASDLQDPPELTHEFIKRWEHGDLMVLATKPVSATNFLMAWIRNKYYLWLNRISDIDLIKDATGFGLYDRRIIEDVRKIGDPYPYFRGIVCELGYKFSTIEFNQPRRMGGITKNNFYTLYDIAMLGVISHSLVPIRIASLLGIVLGLASIVAAVTFFILKIVFWEKFPVGIAPILIIISFMFGVMLFFIGILGEYIGSIHSYLQKRPIVVEEKRINF